MKKIVLTALWCLVYTVLPAQSGGFKAPGSCAQATTLYECKTCGEYYYLRAKFSEALPFYEKAEALEHDPERLVDIYDLHESLHLPFDTARFYKPADYEELLYYVKKLNLESEWAMAAFLCKKALALNPGIEAKLLLYDVSVKGNLPCDKRLVTELDSPDDMHQAADYFLEHSDYAPAKSLYERSEKLKHSPYAIIGLHKISLLEHSDFDMKLFLKSKEEIDLFAYSEYFAFLASEKSKNNEKIPYARQSVLLYESAAKLPAGKKHKNALARNYSDLAFFLLFEPNPKEAEQMARKALATAPAFELAHTNLAAALLLQGKYEQAKKEYTAWMNKPIGGRMEGVMEEVGPSSDNLPTFRQVFQQDLAELEKAGITHPDFSKIRTLLGGK